MVNLLPGKRLWENDLHHQQVTHHDFPLFSRFLELSNPPSPPSAAGKEKSKMRVYS